MIAGHGNHAIAGDVVRVLAPDPSRPCTALRERMVGKQYVVKATTADSVLLRHANVDMWVPRSEVVVEVDVVLQAIVDDAPIEQPAVRVPEQPSVGAHAAPTDDVRPNYYRVVCPVRAVGENTERATHLVEVECQDLIESLGLTFNEGNVLKYLFRKGRKSPSPVEDLRKVRTYAGFALAEATRVRDDHDVVRTFAPHPRQLQRCASTDCPGTVDPVTHRCDTCKL